MLGSGASYSNGNSFIEAGVGYSSSDSFLNAEPPVIFPDPWRRMP